jgi:hypothetical protein
VNTVPIRLVTYPYPMPASGSAKPSAPPVPGEPNERALPKRQFMHGFMKPRENCPQPQAFVVEPARQRNRRRGQQVERLFPQSQLASSSREDAVRVGHRAGGAHTVARRHLQIARAHTGLIEVDRRTRVHDERAGNIRTGIQPLDQEPHGARRKSSTVPNFRQHES